MNGYELKLIDNKWYVGITSKSVSERFREHINKKGAKWTCKYKSLSYSETILSEKINPNDWESRRTAELCVIYGIHNVRGANFCMLEPTPEQFNSQAILIGHLLGLSYDNVMYKVGLKDCSEEDCSEEDCSEEEDEHCDRCGRTGHIKSNCYARINRYKYEI